MRVPVSSPSAIQSSCFAADIRWSSTECSSWSKRCSVYLCLFWSSNEHQSKRVFHLDTWLRRCIPAVYTKALVCLVLLPKAFQVNFCLCVVEELFDLIFKIRSITILVIAVWMLISKTVEQWGYRFQGRRTFSLPGRFLTIWRSCPGFKSGSASGWSDWCWSSDMLRYDRISGSGQCVEECSILDRWPLSLFALAGLSISSGSKMIGVTQLRQCSAYRKRVHQADKLNMTDIILMLSW